jgi:chemotaxis protein CheZ
MANELQPLLTLSQAKKLVAFLEADNTQAANEVVEQAVKLTSGVDVFDKVGELTRELHQSLLDFYNDSRLVDITSEEIPDAQERLQNVIKMTDDAANKTMDSIDTCMPLLDGLADEIDAIKPNWDALMTRKLALQDFKSLCHKIDAMIVFSSSSASSLRSSLTDILMAQDFQDLTGQMIRRVITLVEEIETKLVSILQVCNQEVESTESKKETKSINAPDISAEGPIINAASRADAVNGQDDVDDLLSSLGF